MTDFKKELEHGFNIRALSWKEPYASLMLHQKIETRTWYTNYRGLVLICTSKKMYNTQQILDISGENQFKRIFDILDDGSFLNTIGMHRGHAIAIGKLIDCRIMYKKDEDDCFVQHDHNLLWCHVYADVQAIKPFEWKGSQGWSKVSKEIIDKIEFL